MNRFVISLSRLSCSVQSRTSHSNWTRQLSHRISDAPEEKESWKSMEQFSRSSVNYVPLSPISFLERSAVVFGDRTSIIYGDLKFNWEDTYRRCVKLASALANLGISRGDVVATLAPNVPAMHELHFAVPMTAGVLCTLNTRHDPHMISVLLEHSEAKIIFVDHQFVQIAQTALDLLAKSNLIPPKLVLIVEPEDSSSTKVDSNKYEYESLLKTGDEQFKVKTPKTELDPISINYTSGTTSRPKGVVYSHRGAYLNAIGSNFIHGINAFPVYLWTVPMFHCNGWCLVWGVAAMGGTNICTRRVDPEDIYNHIYAYNVTHMGGAPTVLNMIVNSPASHRKPLPHKVEIVTGGAPPPPTILSKMEDLGFGVTHLYGLTETYGPGTSCVWRPEWNLLPPEKRLKLRTRQGVKHALLEEVDVKDNVTMESVPADGKTMGEVIFRGNTVMIGYYKDPKVTAEAFKGGWFWSGDLAVKHSDGYIEVKDRLKDIIISGGENISTAEVESVLYSHPAVLEAAVVARPDKFWGQTPCAFVKLKDKSEVSGDEIIRFCRDNLPHYMAPKTVVFEDLPKTSTGKIQKFVLREKANAMGSIC